MKMQIKIKILDERLGRDFPLPSYETAMSAGMDLRAMEDSDFILNPGEVRLVHTGFAMHIADPNVTALVVPRSGLGYKHGIVLSNLTGVIDADYQGPLMMPLWNHSNEPFEIKVGDRVAQMLFVPVIHADLQVTNSFDEESERGQKGFGSTGL
ncbi:MAG: dUTP diphosphatase [Succinatimonas sp.]|nr:dUTP diphosphatase [Succinatimonas sp.]MDD5868839.1 dUTP diphosphatase [Succinatimonas sp.]MDY5721032.1 dUTP diphosphatase [Succinivibrio sp.]